MNNRCLPGFQTKHKKKKNKNKKKREFVDSRDQKTQERGVQKKG